MARVRMVFQYDGTGYVGWQVQPNGVAVQEVVQRELSRLVGEEAVLHASGRTDSGVHALAQVAHFDTQSRIPPEKMAFALNAGLPADIRVMHSERAPDAFHARFDALQKHYRYSVQTGPHAGVFRRNTALHLYGALAVEQMNAAAQALLGTHDFAAFKAAGVELKSTVRTLYRSEWTKCGDVLYYDVVGSGFMYNMVRILVGTMLEVGLGRREAGAVETALHTLNRADAGATAPAKGLMLARVVYPDFDTANYCTLGD